ncbi:hypothetical protein B0H14DRAFT_3889573 [Mycena olivaceomarginata]|nr:hypothetical protein B0H14DRAFT_3889573 [Mycena olivaceomarginata]
MSILSALARFGRRLCCIRSKDGSEDPYAAEPTNRFTARGPRELKPWGNGSAQGQSGQGSTATPQSQG